MQWIRQIENSRVLAVPAMTAPDSTLSAQIRQRLLLSQIISQNGIALIPTSQGYKALCPFHSEKTPSFSVNDQKGLFYCFGCHAKGDIFTFVQKYHNLTWPQALEHLAAQAGIRLEKKKPDSPVYPILKDAADWFYDRLFSPEGEPARLYLQQRGITETTAQNARLGYAPPSPSDLYRHLKRYPAQDLEKSGLFRMENKSFFRQRLMFPISDSSDRVVGFGGRLIQQGPGPKYLNSPETEVFHKSRLLYGLSQAKKGLSDPQTPLIVVEGYLDVLSLVQAGYQAVVAPLGTALSQEQIQALWNAFPPQRSPKEPICCFDYDPAGLNAIKRVARIALSLVKPDHSLRFALLRPHAFHHQTQDPDTFIRTKGRRAFQSILDHSLDLVTVIWEIIKEDVPPSKGKDALTALRNEYLALIKDSAIKENYRLALQKYAFQESKTSPPSPLSSPKTQKQRIFLSILTALLLHPLVINHVREYLTRTTFIPESFERLKQAILAATYHAAVPDSETLVSLLKKQDHQPLLSRLLEDQDTFEFAPFAHSDIPLDVVIKEVETLLTAPSRSRYRHQIQEAASRYFHKADADSHKRLSSLVSQDPLIVDWEQNKGDPDLS